MAHPEHQVTVSSVLILWRKNTIRVFDELILGRNAEDGKLTFIGGGIENKETVEAGLYREFYEETGKRLGKVADWCYLRRGYPRFGYKEGSLSSIGVVFEALVDPRQESYLLGKVGNDGELLGLEVHKLGELAKMAIDDPRIFCKPRWNLENIYDAIQSLSDRESFSLVINRETIGVETMIQLRKVVEKL